LQLVIGNPGITEGMSRVQLSVWSIWSAPLIMSNDLRSIRPEFRAILQNARVLAIDQDPMGRMGRMVHRVSSLMLMGQRGGINVRRKKEVTKMS
jgi:alpha-N-acetylgalactosaminidase